MRDLKRIDAVLRVVARAWKKNPDMRLGQLIANASGSDPFYIEDDLMVARIQELFGVPVQTKRAGECKACGLPATHRTGKYCEQHKPIPPHAKYVEREPIIRKLLAEGAPLKVFAERFGVSKTTASAIVHRFQGLERRRLNGGNDDDK